MNVRVADESDIDVLVRLFMEFRSLIGDEYSSDQHFHEGIKQVMTDGSATFFLSESDTGLAQVRHRHCIWTASSLVTIEDLYVSPKYRRQGYASSILQSIISYSLDLRAARVEVDVNERNTTAISVYETMGFKIGNPFANESRDILMRYWISGYPTALEREQRQ